MASSFTDTVIFPEGGLNWDDDLLMLPPADARYRENVVISDEGNYNVYTNTLGNVLKSTWRTHSPSDSYPGGTIRVIGQVENKEDLATIFFVYSSTGEHSIIQYKSGTDELEYILRGSDDTGAVGTLLNFSDGIFEDAGIIGNEDDKYLVWTDGINPPRMINIELAIGYSYGLSTAYSEITETTVSLYKVPYLNFINCSYLSVTNQNNILRGWLWQFAVRLKYVDNTYSVLSPFSEIPIPEEDEYINGIVVEPSRNNKIQVVIVDLEDPMIAEYQLCFRRVDIESGVPSEWYLSNTPFTDSGAIRVAIFSGDVDSIILPTSYSSKIQDWVPDLADHVGIIDSNRIVLGDVTEGYENLPTDATAYPGEVLDVSLSTAAVTIPTFYDYEDSAYNVGAASDTLTIDFNASEKRYYKFFVVSSKSPNRKSYAYYSPDVKSDVADYIEGSINQDFGAGTVSLDGSNDLVINGDAGNETFVYLNTTGENFHVPVFKTNATHQFGVIYIYEGKYGFVQKNDDCLITIPIDTAGVFDSANTIEASIDNLAPLGATHYQWVYLGSDIDYSEEYLIEIVADVEGNILENEFVLPEGDYLKIKRSYLLTFTRNVFGDSIDFGFDFQKGDIISFKGEFTNWSITPNHNVIELGDLTTFSEPLQATVLEVTTSYITIQNIIQPDLFTLYVVRYLVFDFIRRREISSSEEFQAIPGIYSIDTATRYHTGNSQNQTGAQPAIVSFEGFGDYFFTKRIFVNDLNYEDLYYTDSNPAFPDGKMYWFRSNSEQKNFSLMYDSQIREFGKPNVVNEFAQRLMLRKIRWGGKFLDNSGVNFISSFDFDDERIMDDRNGEINFIQQIGDTLKVYQERKVNSLYLKTTSSTAADGSQTYVFSGAVMSDVRQSVTDYGLTHFSSYVKTVRTAYGFDLTNATVWKDTPGGIIPIGDLKMKTYFRDKVRQIQSAGISNVDIYGGYDEYLNMYLLTFKSATTPAINETIGFYEASDRWLSFYSYVPEYYSKISGDTAITFNAGQLYMQNKNATRNNFFGVQDTSIVDVVSKGNPGSIKVWDSIDILSTGQFAPDQDGDIEITLPILMQSKILPGYFEYQEGIYHADFLRDQLDGGSVATRENLHNGRQLRGSEMRIRLRNADTGEANLRIVNIKSTISQ